MVLQKMKKTAEDYLGQEAVSYTHLRENKKFIYGAVRKGSRAKDFEQAIQWLVDAGIVSKVSRIKEPKMPLKFYEDRDAFKLFLLDCGLLACMTDALSLIHIFSHLPTSHTTVRAVPHTAVSCFLILRCVAS